VEEMEDKDGGPKRRSKRFSKRENLQVLLSMSARRHFWGIAVML
jgi:hypothetical protein